MVGRLLVGTASWTDKPLLASGWYPDEARTPEDRLRHYAAQFPLVEVDSTYYALPSVANAERWVERTSDGFTFEVKAFGLFTEHPTPVSRLPKEVRSRLPDEPAAKKNFYLKDAPKRVVNQCWSAFVDGIAPLHEAGKLGVVVLQLPKWSFPNRETKDYLAEVKDRLGDYRGAMSSGTTSG